METRIGIGGQIYYPKDKCLYVSNGSIKNGTRYFKCVSGKSGSCKVTGKLIGNTFSVNNKQHSHHNHELIFEAGKREEMMKIQIKCNPDSIQQLIERNLNG